MKKTQTLPSFFQFLGTIVDRFGWPGALLACGIFEFETHATAEQHRDLIDKFLGHGTGTFWPIAVSGLLFVLVALAQRHHYRKEADKLKQRIDELAEEKNRLHEALTGRLLRHAAEIEAPLPVKTPPPVKPRKPPKSK